MSIAALSLAAALAGQQLASLGGPPPTWPTPDKICRTEIDAQSNPVLLDAVIAACKDDIRYAPNDAEAYLQRGVALYHEGDYQTASADLVRAQGLAPDRADVLFYLGLVANKLGNPKGAIERYSEALKRDPKQTSAYLNRGALYVAAAQYERAIADYSQALALEKDDASIAFRRGFARLQAGDFKGAIADYSQGLKQKPDSDAYRYRGVAKRNLGDYAGAVADYDEALKLSPGDAGALLSRGIAYSYMLDGARAISDYTQAIALDGSDPNAHLLRASALRTSGKKTEALADLDSALRLDPNNAYAHADRGGLDYELGNFAAAIDDDSAAIAIDPKLSAAYGNRCRARAAAGTALDAALADCNQAIVLSPKEADFYAGRAFVSLKLGHYDDAVADVNRALELGFKDSGHRATALFTRGLAVMRKSDGASGKADLDAAYALDPDVKAQMQSWGIQAAR